MVSKGGRVYERLNVNNVNYLKNYYIVKAVKLLKAEGMGNIII